ncbi:hypothetical protein [Nocardia brasiliensis]|uniref:Uncharacterized protein n=1 Tax=Nocardia brasiliensis (strain ATCC 700358 / HUJEG-1) TaxID=1133849 RepID=K0EX37_NOCB7|nr:hypothetical protein [Nocardia brasiliensis]AFU02047.1 hypothetical protein O3I_020440 [Nocardia brasiliensis ATCC 700358]OCF87734.1 hypothetical protein AW168_24965 [Nocardia brasiliensis]
MYKIFSAALLTAAAVGSLVLVPATAHAKSPACDTAIAWINAAIDMSPDGNLDAATLQSLSARLSGLPAVGEEKAAIDAYAAALLDDSADMDAATDAFNAVCAS